MNLEDDFGFNLCAQLFFCAKIINKKMVKHRKRYQMRKAKKKLIKHPNTIILTSAHRKRRIRLRIRIIRRLCFLMWKRG